MIFGTGMTLAEPAQNDLATLVNSLTDNTSRPTEDLMAFYRN
jgi:hypothetical protein